MTAEYYFIEGKFYPKSRPRVTANGARCIFIYSSDADCVTIDGKSGKFYCILNDALRDRDRSKATPFLPFVKLAMSALSKLQRKENRILWRGVDKDLYAVYHDKKGENIVWWGFTSTTTEMSVIDAFLPPNGGTIFCILTEYVIDVQELSAFGAEKET
eukprot:CAMPEP_0113703194 /NCGR_PEP_ID=MMETSP0038_2-20120614/25694_1 /TAXON_ID=2898 /ORGANISM="Cryptomonas paramecium" /LENGTH=157 /DNA_ID=CAMNT_0000627569 /DNA_START=83 /DNA_END=553 /DNA_ORIENTATION=- /assembly_acc=CAM_ASM_000170